MIRFVTRWALSTGIRKVEGEYSDDKKYFRVGPYAIVSANEVFATLEEAQEEAQRLAVKKIASLKKQVVALSDPNWKAKVVE